MNYIIFELNPHLSYSIGDCGIGGDSCDDLTCTVCDIEEEEDGELLRLRLWASDTKA